jgi:DNA-binding response OmpR family regulator
VPGAGCRDYLTKPFSLAELAARVRVQLRADHQRSERTGGPGLVIDVTRMQADAGIGPVPLTRTEFLLLMELREHPGASVSKKQLLEAVWDLDFDPGSNVVDVCVRRLRSKLGTEMIRTIRGSGYQLVSSHTTSRDVAAKLSVLGGIRPSGFIRVLA